MSMKEIIIDFEQSNKFDFLENENKSFDSEFIIDESFELEEEEEIQITFEQEKDEFNTAFDDVHYIYNNLGVLEQGLAKSGPEEYRIKPTNAQGFSEVLVLTDQNLKPENILSPVTIFGVKGEISFKPLKRTLTSNGSFKRNPPKDDKCTGYNDIDITVNVQPNLGKLEQKITSNGTKTWQAKNYNVDGYKEVAIEVAVPTAVVGQVGKVTPKETGQTLEPATGYNAFSKIEVDPVNFTNLSILSDELDFSNQNSYSRVRGDNEFYKNVTIEKPAGLEPGNIVSTATICGIQGTVHEGANINSHTFGSSELTFGSTSQKTFYANQYTDNDGSKLDGFSEITIKKDVDLVPGNISAGTTIYGVTGTGEIINAPSFTYIEPNFSRTNEYEFSPPSPYNCFKQVRIAKPGSLIPSNIASGVTIFGITGQRTTDTEAPIFSVPAEIAKNNVILTPTDQTKTMTQVTLRQERNLVPENIKDGATIFGVTGNYNPPLQQLRPVLQFQELTYRPGRIENADQNYYGFSEVIVPAISSTLDYPNADEERY